MNTTVVRHRPAGLEHPYADSPDQRAPFLPEDGRRVQLGVVAEPEVTAVTCEWTSAAASRDDDALRLPMTPAAPDSAGAAALAGGEGHLAEAQAASLDSDGSWTVKSPPVEAGRRYRYRFHAVTGDGAAHVTDWFDLAPAHWTDEPAGELRVNGPLAPSSVRWLVSPDGAHRVRFTLPLRPGDHVVGFGERFDALDQHGRTLDAVVFEQYKAQGVHGRTYLPMPFAHVVNADGSGWGFHVRTTRRTWYDVAVSAPDALTIEVALGGTPDESLGVDVYTGRPHEIVQAFTGEVGRAEELPDWVFRLWASGNEWNTQRIVMDRLDRHHDLDIPVGVVVIEAWSDEEGITIFRDARYAVTTDGSAHDADDFSYPAAGAWPDPKAMVDDLHARGIKVVLWQIPLLKTRHELDDDVPDDAQVLLDGAAMVRDGHAVLEADGSPYHNRGWWFPQALMPDLSVQRTRDWWTSKRRYLVRDLDVDGFKTDGGEHAWGHDLRYADGRRGDEGNNLYPVHYARAFGDLLRSEGKAPVTFSRAGFTGTQAHGIVWAGDEDSTWEAFRSSVTAGLTASACGIVYWGWDLAGFSGLVPDAELYLRATAAATFMPIMQYHSEFNHHRQPLRDRTPWWVAEVNDDPDVVDVFRRYAKLRERLVAYLAEQARHTIGTGRPLMRAPFFDHASDPEIWAWPYEYLLGDDLLVHPVTEPGVTRWRSYLPHSPDGWVDVWTGEAISGRAVTERDVPRDVVPVYCRAAAWPRLRAVFDA